MTIKRPEKKYLLCINGNEDVSQRIKIVQDLPPSTKYLEAIDLFESLSSEQRIKILIALPRHVTTLDINDLFKGLSVEKRIEILIALPKHITTLDTDDLFKDLSLKQRIKIIQSLPTSITTMRACNLLDNLDADQKIEILSALPLSIIEFNAHSLFYDLSVEQKIKILGALPLSCILLENHNLFSDLSFQQRIEILEAFPPSITALNAYGLFSGLSFEAIVEILEALPSSITTMSASNLLDNLEDDQKIAMLRALSPSIRELIFAGFIFQSILLQDIIAATTIDLYINPFLSSRQEISDFGAFIGSNLMLFVSRTITISGSCYDSLAKLNDFQDHLDLIDFLEAVDLRIKTALETKDNFLDVHLGGYKLESLERIEGYLALLKKQDHAVAYLALGILYNNQAFNPDNSSQDNNLDTAIEYYMLAAEKDVELKGIAGFLIEQIQFLNENMDADLDSKIAVALKKLQYESSATFKSLQDNPLLFAKPKVEQQPANANAPRAKGKSTKLQPN